MSRGATRPLPGARDHTEACQYTPLACAIGANSFRARCVPDKPRPQKDCCAHLIGDVLVVQGLDGEGRLLELVRHAHAQQPLQRQQLHVEPSTVGSRTRTDCSAQWSWLTDPTHSLSMQWCISHLYDPTTAQQTSPSFTFGRAWCVCAALQTLHRRWHEANPTFPPAPAGWRRPRRRRRSGIRRAPPPPAPACGCPDCRTGPASRIAGRELD